MTKELKVAMIGAGMIGKSYAIGLATLGMYDWPREAVFRRELLVEATPELAEDSARRYGFERHTADWRVAVEDPEIDVVFILTPVTAHEEVAMATIDAGKALVCEKPLATTAQGSWRMYDAAERAGIVHQTGFNFRLSPALQLAQKMVREGAIGEVQNFRAFFMHDVYVDPQAPYTWHNKRAEAGGAITDSGVHAIDFARNLVGEIGSVVATSYQVTDERPDRDGNMVPVDVEDNALVLLRFENGAPGTIESTRATLGKKHASGFELFGTRGSLAYDYERNQELRYYDGSDAPDRAGFRTILVRPDYPREDLFFPLPGTGMNWPDMKVIQLAELADAITAGRPVACDLGDAWRAQEVAEAVLRSIEKNGWEEVVMGRAVAT